MTALIAELADSGFVPAPVPVNEARRLAALEACGILDTPADPVFDAITALAARYFGVPSAVISLVDHDRQWLKSSYGLWQQGAQTSRAVSFCAHTILQPDALMVVPDATLDPRFAGNPLVAAAPGLRFYAAVPLCLADGNALGALCLIDTVPRSFSPEDQALLADLGRCVSALLESCRSVADLQKRDAALQNDALQIDLARPQAGSWLDTLRAGLTPQDATPHQPGQSRPRARQAAFIDTVDALTGLPSRAHFNAIIAQRGADSARRDAAAAGFAVFSIDVDNLKSINRTSGPDAGDAVLAETATRLAGCLGADDVLARSGGDSFLLMAPGAPERDTAGALAARILASFQRPLIFAGQMIAITVSIGVALWPADGPEVGMLLPNAALALARAKDEGRATFRFFEREADEALRVRQALRVELNTALDRGEFALAFQPLIDMRSGQIDGFEALLRWHHPRRGTISPGEFIPIAESSGMIAPIGAWVLAEACRIASAWPEHITVAVNLSPVQFAEEHDLIGVVESVLAETGFPPHRLELEITESLPLLDADANLATLFRLRALGVRIALDDFGAGYSSLGYLQRFTFDKLKIDRSIISQICGGARSRAVLRAILGMARTLGISVTAEGVEQAAQAECLRDEGCDQMQGFYFGMPIPAMEAAAALAA